MNRNMLLLLGLLVLSLFALSCVADSTPPPVDEEGTLTGAVVIGPLCPVEPCDPAFNPYTSRVLLLRHDAATTVQVPLQPDGSFNVLLPPGEYSVEVSDCDFLGCPSVQPSRTIIVSGETTLLTIQIDTGIRSPSTQPTPTPTPPRADDPAPCEPGQSARASETGEYLCFIQVRAPIDGVEVIIRESFPPQYALRITSGLRNSCVRFDHLAWQRDGNTIRVDVFNVEPADVDLACAQVYGTVEHTVELGTAFVPGEQYTAAVNDLTETFLAQ